MSSVSVLPATPLQVALDAIWDPTFTAIYAHTSHCGITDSSLTESIFCVLDSSVVPEHLHANTGRCRQCIRLNRWIFRLQHYEFPFQLRFIGLIIRTKGQLMVIWETILALMDTTDIQEGIESSDTLMEGYDSLDLNQSLVELCTACIRTNETLQVLSTMSLASIRQSQREYQYWVGWYATGSPGADHQLHQQ